MSNETWKDIVGYESYYQVSNLGRIRSIYRYVNHSSSTPQFRRGQILKTATNRCGYEMCALNKYGSIKSFSIHGLVAKAFIDNNNGYKEINHIDGNKLNNKVENLEWSTRSDNLRHAIRTGLFVHKKGGENANALIKTEERAKIFELKNSGLSGTEIAKIYNVSFHTIYRILKPETYAKRRNIANA